MADTFLSLVLAMIQLMCVIIVAAYLLTRSKFFVSVLEGHPAIKVQIILILFFGALSVYGTMGGIGIMDAVINVRRDLWTAFIPMSATSAHQWPGLLGGPPPGGLGPPGLIRAQRTGIARRVHHASPAITRDPPLGGSLAGPINLAPVQAERFRPPPYSRSNLCGHSWRACTWE